MSMREASIATIHSLVDGKGPALVVFWASWCEHCAAFKPVMAQVAKELGRKVRVVRCGVEDRDKGKFASHCGVDSLPAVLLVVGDRRILRCGADTAAGVLRWVRKETG